MSGRCGARQEVEHRAGLLPDFRNLGVAFKVLVLGEAINVFVLFALAPGGRIDVLAYPGAALGYELTLLAVLGVLALGAPWLRRMQYRLGIVAVIAAAAPTAVVVDLVLGGWLGAAASVGWLKAAVLAAVITGVILIYFDWRQRVLSPAVLDARLEALQARIRPHFLFNGLNTAVAVLRESPKLAESVLLDMADLFRVVLAEPRALVPLRSELRVARAYLDVEQLRLGDRLEVKWSLEGVPEDVLVPVLLLQPLLENAVRHGVELLEGAGEVEVRLAQHGRFLEMVISNPVPHTLRTAPEGHRMALANIAERLALHFDEEGQLQVREGDNRFVVRVRMPIRREAGGANGRA